jgi:hypothetical protein
MRGCGRVCVLASAVAPTTCSLCVGACGRLTLRCPTPLSTVACTVRAHACIHLLSGPRSPGSRCVTASVHVLVMACAECLLRLARADAPFLRWDPKHPVEVTSDGLTAKQPSTEGCVPFILGHRVCVQLPRTHASLLDGYVRRLPVVAGRPRRLYSRSGQAASTTLRSPSPCTTHPSAPRSVHVSPIASLMYVRV